MKKFLLLTAIACTASLAAVAPAMAQSTTTGTITVGAGTAALCTAPTAVSVALGNYNGTGVATGSTDVTFRCTATTPATVTLLSASAGGTTTGGKLSSPAGTTPINYTFTGNNTPVTGTGLSAGQDITVPVGVNVAAGQNPAPATYEDTINVTVTY